MANGLKGKAIAFTGDSGTSEAVTFTNGTNLVNSAGTAFVNGKRIEFVLGIGGALPAELSVATTYFVINKTTNDFQVSLTLGGDAVEFSTDGSLVVNAVEQEQLLKISGACKFSISSAGILQIWTASQAEGGAVNGQASFKQTLDAASAFTLDSSSSQNNSDIFEDIVVQVPDAVKVVGFIWGQGASWTIS